MKILLSFSCVSLPLPSSLAWFLKEIKLKGLCRHSLFFSLRSLLNVLISLSKSDGAESSEGSGACDGWWGGQRWAMPPRGTVQGASGGPAGPPRGLAHHPEDRAAHPTGSTRGCIPQPVSWDNRRHRLVIFAAQLLFLAFRKGSRGGGSLWPRERGVSRGFERPGLCSRPQTRVWLRSRALPAAAGAAAGLSSSVGV